MELNCCVWEMDYSLKRRLNLCPRLRRIIFQMSSSFFVWQSLRQDQEVVGLFWHHGMLKTVNSVYYDQIHIKNNCFICWTFYIPCYANIAFKMAQNVHLQLTMWLTTLTIWQGCMCSKLQGIQGIFECQNKGLQRCCWSAQSNRFFWNCTWTRK